MKEIALVFGIIWCFECVAYVIFSLLFRYGFIDLFFQYLVNLQR